MDLKLKGRVALITGAAQGLGRAEAEALADEGAFIALNDINAEAAEVAAHEITSRFGVKAMPFVADVTQEAEVGSLIDDVAAEFGAVDILVNNAGIAGPHVGHLIENLALADWDAIINSHLRSTFMCSRCVIPVMKRGGFGRIVNTSSINHTGGGRPGVSNYGTAKAGIAGFTRILAKEVGTFGGTANTIAPGFIGTELIKHFPQDRLRRIKEQTPVGRLGRPEEVGALVTFLCSEQAAYITGALIGIDGGRQDYHLP